MLCETVVAIAVLAGIAVIARIAGIAVAVCVGGSVLAMIAGYVGVSVYERCVIVCMQGGASSGKNPPVGTLHNDYHPNANYHCIKLCAVSLFLVLLDKQSVRDLVTRDVKHREAFRDVCTTSIHPPC